MAPSTAAATLPDRASRPTLAMRALLDSLYCLSALFVALPFFVVIVTGLALSAGLAVILGGVLLLPVTIYIARGNAFFERLRLRGMLHWPAPAPAYSRGVAGASWWQRVLVPVRDPQSWLDVLWSVIGLASAIIAFVVAVTWWAAVLGGLSYWAWQRYLPDGPDDHGLAYYLGLGDSRTAESLLNAGFGMLALLTLPLAVRGAALLHGRIASALLCSRAELQEQVARVTYGRNAARAAEAEALRRLERDIHDGPQQRLVRLTMDLGRARQRLDGDPDAQALVDEALRQARETVSELRALSRGVAPPLLVDRGLRAAVEEMLTHAAVPVQASLDIPEGLAPHIETATYFVLAEALTNVAKHSGAGEIRVRIAPEGDTLRVEVGDDGVGGAHLAKGLGLAGLRQRLDAVEGSLHVDSPSGGPTLLSATLPLERGASATDDERNR